MNSDWAPWDPAELHWQLNRPRRHWTPIPNVGDRVFYRHEHWGPVTAAQVLDVQSLDDYSDHYLWHVVRDDRGEAMRDELGRYILRPVADPWVTLTLATDWGTTVTREARVRGSAGWLPLDWQTRFHPAPGGGVLIRPRSAQ